MKNLFKYTLTLLLSATLISLPVGIQKVQAEPTYYYIYGMKIPHTSIVKNYLVNNEMENFYQLLEGEIDFFNAPGLETLFNQNNPRYTAQVYITDINPGNPKAVVTPTGVVICIGVAVGGIIIYCVYKIATKLDSPKTNAIQRELDSSDSLSMILPKQFKLLSVESVLG